jgi:hypothetical protein
VFKGLKGALLVLIGLALVIQLTSCVYVRSDHRYHPWWHHEVGVGVHVHG